jgi:hypothetical protein
MAYREYVAPGISVIVERAPAVEATTATEFFPVFIGTGITSLSRTTTKTHTTTGAATSKTFTYDFSGDVSTTMYTLTDATIQKFNSTINATLSVDILSRLTIDANPKTLDGTGSVNFIATFPSVAVFKTAKVATPISNATTTALVVDDLSAFYTHSTPNTTVSPIDGGPAGTSNRQFIKVGTEIMRISSIETATNTLTVTRGQANTQALASISANTTITALPTVGIPTPTTGISDTENVIVVQNGVSPRVAVGQILKFFKIGSNAAPEQVLVTAINGNNITVVRGVLGTTKISLSPTDFAQFFLESPSDDYATSSKTSFSLEISLDNTVDDFEPRLVILNDRFNVTDIFGPYELKEPTTSDPNNVVRNDLAIAAEIAFRSNVPGFYYLEVPRNYGQSAPAANFNDDLIEKIFYKRNIYRVVPLVSDDGVNGIGSRIKNFVEVASDPTQNDRREMVAFMSRDLSSVSPAQLNDINFLSDDTNDSVAKLSIDLNSSRVCNVFGAKTVDITIGTTTYTLPEYFLNVAVASLDSEVGMSNSISQRTISAGTPASIFRNAVTPRFRANKWNQLAEHGVMIVQRDDVVDPLTIRHQLTTEQTDNVLEQEYSIVKSLDAIAKGLRDRMSGYAGRTVIDSTLIEKLNGSLDLAIADMVLLGYCREINVLSSWTTAPYAGYDESDNRRSLIVKLQVIPAYPANNLEIFLII